ncbi:MAG: DUF3857 domain-containing protein [Blastocatellia bacterium]|nr:DUF3857 domain-containing protein [Blastocatellia bacterium]
MNFYRFAVIILMALVCSIIASAPAYAAGDDWRPIDPANLALKEPTVEPDADAEAIFWEVRVMDEFNGNIVRMVLWHYIRIKVFTERGKESQSRIDIPYYGGDRIRDIAARTIKPDGTILELGKDAIFDRTIAKVGRAKYNAKSFTLPGVEPGVIIEYRWKEERNNELASYIRLRFQRDIPIQQIKYYLKPLSLPGFPFGMRSITFHGQSTPFVKEKDGFYSTTMSKVPAFREEPRMPPEYQVTPWMLVYYSEDKKLSPDKYWKGYGKEVYNDYKSSLKVNNDVKKAAAEAIGDAATPDEKIERLFRYCRSRIKNINSDASGLTADDRAKLKDNNNPGDTLKRGMGTGFDISMLFGALAAAAGFDVRVAKLADRSDVFVDFNFPDSYFLKTYDIAVKVGEEWRFCDPGSTYVPYGMLSWHEEGQQALVSDPKEPFFVKTPLSPPEKSREKRTARLRLSEDGTLEGEVRIEYTGHLAIEKKNYNDEDSPEQREGTLRDMVRARMSTAEISDMKIENVTDPDKPFVYAYRVRVPGYAQRTGKRLFLQPAFFQKGAGPLFATSERKHDIYFRYPWSEEDTVIIELPVGFSLDTPDAPPPFVVNNLGKYDVALSISKDGRTLVYTRATEITGMLFPSMAYPQLKQIFDVLHERDNHTITLKQEAGSSN